MKKKNLGISLLTALLLGATAQAYMITGGGDHGIVTIIEHHTFNITTNANQVNLVFDGIVTDDGSNDQAFFSGLQYSINGGTPIDLTTWVDNFSTTAFDITPNDGYLYGGYATLSAGDTVTLLAGTGTMTSKDTNFNPWSSGDYDGFVSGNGNKILDVVPEPATAGLLGIASLVLFGIRRIKNFNRPV